MKMEHECEMCGAPATHMWGFYPLCNNLACRESLIDVINGELQMCKQEEENDIDVEGVVDNAKYFSP